MGLGAQPPLFNILKYLWSSFDVLGTVLGAQEARGMVSVSTGLKVSGGEEIYTENHAIIMCK